MSDVAAPVPAATPAPARRPWRVVYRVVMVICLVIAIGGACLLGFNKFEEYRRGPTDFRSSSDDLATLLSLPVMVMYLLTMVRVAVAIFTQPRAKGRKPQPVADFILGSVLVAMLVVIATFAFNALYRVLLNVVAPTVFHLLRYTVV